METCRIPRKLGLWRRGIGGRQVFKTYARWVYSTRLGLSSSAECLGLSRNLVCGNLHLSTSWADIIIIILLVVHPQNLVNIHFDCGPLRAVVAYIHEYKTYVAKKRRHTIYRYVILNSRLFNILISHHCGLISVFIK